MSIYFKNRTVIDIEIEDIDPRDYPDFCDAYVSHAVWEDTGTELTDKELNELAETCSDQVYEAVLSQVY
jgi:hypothetical protein